MGTTFEKARRDVGLPFTYRVRRGFARKYLVELREIAEMLRFERMLCHQSKSEDPIFGLVSILADCLVLIAAKSTESISSSSL